MGRGLSWLLFIPLMAGLGFLLQPQAAMQPPPTPEYAAAPARTSIPTPMPAPVRTALAPAPAASHPSLHPSPPSGAERLVLTPDAERVGWGSDLDDRLHLAAPAIHVGRLNGYTYQAALQFDMAALPADASITYAGLELTALDASHAAAGGAWRLDLLPEELDEAWPTLSYQALRGAEADAAASVSLAAESLGAGQVNVIPFGAALRQALQQRGGGTASFRLDGPESGQDSLMTWDTGHRPRRELNSQPLLVILFVRSEPRYIIVTSTPTPENVLTVAAIAARATEVARTTGTFTPTPRHWVTPAVVTPKPLPGNAATAAFQSAAATAEAFLYGTPTRAPPNVWTATPTPAATQSGPDTPAAPLPATRAPTSTPTPVYVALAGQLPTLPPTRTPTPGPLPMPRALIGKIAFLSDRAARAGDQSAPPLSDPQVYVINPDGSGLAILTDRWPYDQAVKRDRLSADQHYRAFVRDIKLENGRQPAVHYYDYLFGVERQVTTFGSGIAYDPVWSPAADRIAMVSNDSGSDEIWVVNRDGSSHRQLTRDPYSWWDKHPSWSPDGKQIVFWSNRTGSRQLWIMDADGGEARIVSFSGYNDWDPVWIKYEDPPRYHFNE